MELALKPLLLSVLKGKLDDALAQVQTEDPGRGAIDKLRVLQLLSKLPDEEEQDTGDRFPFTAARLLCISLSKT